MRKWDNEGWVYAADYGVPDSRILPKIQLRSVRVKNVPVFGRVVGVRWQGDDKGTGVAERLTYDQALKAAIISARVEISLYTVPEHGYWLIPHTSKDAPSAELWNCYEMVARGLLMMRKARDMR